METPVGDMSSTIFNDLRLERKLSDVLIKVDGVKFYAHKIILCGCSLYFKDLFTNTCYTPDEDTFNISGVSSKIMELIMEYIYMQPVTITDDNVCELLVAADYLEVNGGLLTECCTFLKSKLCLENCIGLFRKYYHCEKLRQLAFEFILHNFEKMAHSSEDFKELTVDQLCDIIENDNLNVKKEEVVFEAILHWIRHALHERKENIGVLLPKVRLALLPHDYFLNSVKNDALVSDNVTCKSTIDRVVMDIHSIDMNDSLTANLSRPRLPCAVLLAIGGFYAEGTTSAIEAYDPRAGRWDDVPCEKESQRANHGTVFLNGFVYCIGGTDGVNNLSSVRKFNPITRTWAQVGPMHSQRNNVSVCVLNGCIYAMGGFDGHELHKTAERYEPKRNQWTMIRSMHSKRSEASAAAMNGKIYLCGGFDGNVCLFTAEVYTPETNQWTLLPQMSSRRSGLGVIAYGEQVYAIGGFDGRNYLRTAEVYDPEIDSWADIPSMITQRRNFGIEVLDDLLFVVGGHDGFKCVSKVENYDKETDEWHEIKDTRHFRNGLSCCVISDLPNLVQYAAPRQSPHRSHKAGDTC